MIAMADNVEQSSNAQPAPQQPVTVAQKPKKRRPGRVKGVGKFVGKKGHRSPPGRPGVKHDKHLDKHAFNYALTGYTDKKIAELFSISIPTFYKWLKQHKSFKKALEDGREKATGNVARSLYERATGYNHKAEHISVVSRGPLADPAVVRVPYMEHYPPDVGAAKFWLAAKDPAWKEKSSVEISGAGGQPLQPLVVVMSSITPPKELKSANAPVEVLPEKRPQQAIPETVAVVMQPQPVQKQEDSGVWERLAAEAQKLKEQQ